MFRLLYVYESDGCANHAGGLCLAPADEVAEFEQGGRCVSKGEERRGVFLGSDAHGGHGACDVLFACHADGARVVDVADGLDAESLQSPFAYAGLCHGHVGDDAAQRAVGYGLVHAFDGLWVGAQDVLHVEVGRGVDGVQQCPLVSEGHVASVAQFGLDGAEGAYHDVLSGVLGGGVGWVAIVSARCYHASAGVACLTVAEEYDGEHVDVVGAEVAQCGDVDALSLASGLLDVSDDVVGAAVPGKDFDHAVELPVASVAAWVVDTGDEVGLGGSADAAFDEAPGGHEVGERDEAEVVSEGGAEQRCRLLEGRYAGQGDDVELRECVLVFGHFVDEWCHAVDAGIARRDDADALSAQSQFESLSGAFAFLFHAGVNADGVGAQCRGYVFEVGFVSYDDVALADGFEYGGCEVGRIAGSDAADGYSSLIHDVW